MIMASDSAVGSPADSAERASALWASLPRELVNRYRPMVSNLSSDMVREIQRAVPAYAQPLEGQFGKDMKAGVAQAVLHILDTVGTRPTQDAKWAETFRQLGRVEYGEGRSLDSLQTAYRVGGRVAWRHLAAWGQEQRLPTSMLTVAAEAIFAYVDELSALSIEGYTQAQAASVDITDRRRRRLVELILSQPPAAPHTVAKLADLAHWRVPDEVSVIAIDQADDQAEVPTLSRDDEVLMDLDSRAPCVVLGEPDKHLPRLRVELDGRRACVGPSVPLSDAAVSLRWAQRALRLVRRGVIVDDGADAVLWCRDHLATLWLFADEFLVAQLGKRT